uniref:G_PROTEIN_RECEP_F1_2 domain-containing protein n=1 Tax=Mesocestoides corti TaxID=53468 RepID=A0A5K3EKK5_MESCO
MLIKSSNRLNCHHKRESENDTTLSGKEENDEDNDSEKEYAEKFETFASQLKLLNERTHPEFIKSSKRIENWLADQKLRIQILHDYKIDEVHNQYDREIRTCDRDCGIEKKKIQEYLISLCEDLKRRLEHDKKSIELTATGDVLEVKPTITRKLRRRTPEVPSSIVGSSIIGGGSKFGYWGDIQLYSAPWSPAAFSATALKTSTELPPSPCPPTGAAADPTDETPSANIVSAASTSCNIFGSLGVSVEDGNCLVGHLIASMNASAGGNGHGEVGTLSTSGALFAQAALPNSLSCIGGANSSSASVAAVAAAIVPSLTGFTGVQTPKRRKQLNSQPFTQLSLLLPETDIYSDLTLIHRTCGKPSSAGGSKKHGFDGPGSSTSNSSRAGGASPHPSRGDETSSRRRVDTENRRESHRSSHHHHHHHESSSMEGSSGPAVWIDDGRLYIGQSCYQQGTPVYLESHGCSGTVVAVGAQGVSIKRNSDTGIMRITVQQLKHGRYVLAPLKQRQ